MLHGSLKREFIEEQGWLPAEETPEGLVIMCTDPEAVRNSRIVPQVFPRSSKFAYRVTTQTEFEETTSQLFGAGNDGFAVDTSVRPDPTKPSRQALFSDLDIAATADGRSVVIKWLVFGHSSLVTFFCASRRKLPARRGGTRRAAARRTNR